MANKIKVSFSGHDKFDCKLDWLYKGLEHYEIMKDPNIESSIEKLGLGINMVKSLKHWIKVLGLEQNDKLSELAIGILEDDPYFENIDILWIMHWNLAKNKNKTTLYHRFFNVLYLYKFTKEELFDNIIKWLEQESIKLSPNTIKSDIEVFIKMYNNSKENTQGLFSELNLITSNYDFFNLNIGSTATISDMAFLYILNDYMQLSNKDNTVSIEDIQKGEISIQKILCMNERQFFIKIHNLSKLTDNQISYKEASGSRQLYLQKSFDNQEILKKILKA